MNFLKQLFRPRMLGGKRSPKWRAIRKAYIKKHPICEATGATKRLQVHHCHPVFLFPELELEESNLITLEKKAHFILGHHCSYHSYNPNIREDADILFDKIKNRI